VQVKAWHLIGLMAVAVAPVWGQPTDGAQYWSVAKPDCSSLNETAVTIKNDSGVTVGYSCYVTGTFVWLAAGGMWGTTIRAAAPASGAIGVDYTFYDQSGNDLSIDTTLDNDPSTLGGSNDINFALYANQPAEVQLLGASDDAPGYNNTATGSVYAIFYCPDAATCSDVLPQLLYSALPSEPWSLSVPITWDGADWTQWSAVGIENGADYRVSLVIYNEDTVAQRFAVQVFDSAGNLYTSGTTPIIPPLRNLGGGQYGEGGTYGVLLTDVVGDLPDDTYKILVDGGSVYSAVEMLQIIGSSATTLQVAYDSAPGASAAARSVHRVSARKLHVGATPKQVFRTLPRHSSTHQKAVKK